MVSLHKSWNARTYLSPHRHAGAQRRPTHIATPSASLVVSSASLSNHHRQHACPHRHHHHRHRRHRLPNTSPHTHTQKHTCLYTQTHTCAAEVRRRPRKPDRRRYINCNRTAKAKNPPPPPISMLGRVPLPSCDEFTFSRHVASSLMVNIDIGGKGGQRCGRPLQFIYRLPSKIRVLP